ncbi:hypothetical protein [Polaromonas sp. CG9_12]|nr:hypothetical protein [Polaromonas sp. CG9_12]
MTGHRHPFMICFIYSNIIPIFRILLTTEPHGLHPRQGPRRPRMDDTPAARLPRDRPGPGLRHGSQQRAPYAPDAGRVRLGGAGPCYQRLPDEPASVRTGRARGRGG